MLTKQATQSQRCPGVPLPPPGEQVLVLSPSRSALCVNPVSGLGVGGLQPGQRGGGGHWPTGLRQRLQLCLQFPLPLPSLLLSKAPAKKASPSPQPQHRKGGPRGGAGSLGRKKTWAHTLITPHTACTSPEPMWTRMCTGRFSQKGKAFSPHTLVHNTGALRGPRLGSARLALQPGLKPESPTH